MTDNPHKLPWCKNDDENGRYNLCNKAGRYIGIVHPEYLSFVIRAANTHAALVTAAEMIVNEWDRVPSYRDGYEPPSVRAARAALAKARESTP